MEETKKVHGHTGKPKTSEHCKNISKGRSAMLARKKADLKKIVAKLNTLISSHPELSEDLIFVKVKLTEYYPLWLRKL